MSVLKINLLLLPFLFFGLSNSEMIKPSDDEMSALRLTASTKTAKTGESVCIDVVAAEFNQIVSMQYTMKWDKKVLKYKNVQNFQVPAMNKNNFGARTAAEGKLTFSWYDPNVRGITLNPGTALYQVCFDVIGESGSKAYFQFTDYPTITEIMQADGTFLELDWTSGKVSVK